MTTRVFRARSLIQAREAALSALGQDAIIVTTREVKSPGLRGFLGATEVEVAAASLTRKDDLGPSFRAPFAADAYSSEAQGAASGERATRAAVVNALRADLRSEIRAVKQALGGQPERRNADVADLAAEVCAIREAVEKLAPPSPRSGRLAALLRGRGIDGRAGAELARAVRERSPTCLEERLRAHLTTMFDSAPWPLPTKGEQALVAAVGLSGVGKTTTLAKLATHAKARGLRVGLVTCDTFRVGGVEQVMRYGALLDCPVEVARTVAELRACVARTSVDVLFVDTSGRPPTGGAAELLLQRETYEQDEACAAFARHVLLCIPAAGREVDVLRSVKTYAATAPTALAFTKLDETAQPSGMLHAAWATRLPVAVTCTGPRVPEDIAAADIPDIVNGVMPRAEPSKARAA